MTRKNTIMIDHADVCCCRYRCRCCHRCFGLFGFQMFFVIQMGDFDGQRKLSNCDVSQFVIDHSKL